ncbi:MAG: hypothetical protein FJ344_03710 [Sphingomonadales bacterium]|nr:hypothetical protein [Sphingomonadales bacterium]
MNRRARQLLLLFLMLGLPVVIYLAYVNSTENQYHKLPVFGPRYAMPVAVAGENDDTLYHSIAALIRVADRQANRVLVVSFFPEGDSNTTRLRYAQLRRVGDVFSENPLVWMMQVHPTEGNSTNQIPRSEARSLEFVLGQSRLSDSLYRQVAVYRADWQKLFPQSRQEEITILFDKQHRARGFYRTVLRKETDRLMEDVRALIAEYANTAPKRKR